MLVKFISNHRAHHLAHQFFKYCYHDRGMIKWQGFFLSDHQAAIRHQNQLQHFPKLPRQTAQDISTQLMSAWQFQFLVIVQLNQVNKNQQWNTFQGKVKGILGPELLLNIDNRQLKHIKMTNIRAVRQKSSDLDQFR